MYFSVSVACLLVFTAAAKIVAILQHKQFLFLPDPVFSFSTVNATMIIAVAIEIFAAGFLFYNARKLSAMVACSWLTSTFVCYRMLAHAFFAKKPCHCLGGVLDWTGFSENILNAIPIFVLFYIGIGSLSFLFIESAFTKNK
jgi:hypothetical protein